MNGYLGETPVDVTTHPKYSLYTRADWAMLFITLYGGSDGGHHKAWVIDQVARILKGIKVVVVTAKWDNGHEEDRFTLETAMTPEYVAWRAPIETEYGYDDGIPP